LTGMPASAVLKLPSSVAILPKKEGM
jgi:hypothetical protein